MSDADQTDGVDMPSAPEPTNIALDMARAIAMLNLPRDLVLSFRSAKLLIETD